MGNFSSTNKNQDLIHYNSIQTDQMSETMPFNDDTNNFLSLLKDNQENKEIDNFVNNIFSTNNMTGGGKNSDEISTSSPFISEDMYKYLSKEKMLGGENDDMDESDSSTSSSDDFMDMNKSSTDNSPMNNSDNSPMNNSDNSPMVDSTDVQMMGRNNVIDYVSSSAHSQINNLQSSSVNETTITNEYNQVIPESVNTSDINMISIQ